MRKACRTQDLVGGRSVELTCSSFQAVCHLGRRNFCFLSSTLSGGCYLDGEVHKTNSLSCETESAPFKSQLVGMTPMLLAIKSFSF